MRVRDGIIKLFGLCVVAGVLVAGVLFPAVGGAGMLSNSASDTVDNISAELRTKAPPLVSKITDRNGNVLATPYEQYRLPAAPNQISQNMKAAVVATEDARFFEHGGVDVRGTLRAAANDVAGGDTQGASTITQQYVKNYLLNVTDRNDPVAQRRDKEQTLARKLREARIAVQVEQQQNKDQILAGYLNTVAYSKSVYGVAAAAKVFFNTTPDKLSVTQSALLAGVVNNPIALNPWNNPTKALQRRNTVLDRMVQNRALSRQAAEQDKVAPLGVVPEPNLPSNSCSGAPAYAGFFCDYVEKFLNDNGISNEKFRSGGYTVRTSLNPDMAKTARASIKKKINADSPNVTDAFAVVGSGNKNHEVQSMVSNRYLGPDPEEGGRAYNMVSDPTVTFGGGSTFKIFTAAAALENGQAGLDTVLPNPNSVSLTRNGAPKYEQPQGTSNLEGTPPQLSLRDALEKSPNTAFFMLANKVGIGKVISMAKRLGLRDTLDSNTVGGSPITDESDPRHDDIRYNQKQSKYYQTRLSFTLGVSAVSPLEMANVTSTINSGGMWCPPNPVLEIRDRNGKRVPLHTQPCQQVISPSVAKALEEGMKEDTVSGTSAAAARSAGWNRPDFAKTGTTNTNQSVAFVAGVNNFGAASMVYSDGSDPEPICDTTPVSTAPACGGQHAGGAFGGSVAAPPYFDAFNKVLAGTPPDPVEPPPSYMLSSGGRTPIVPRVLGQKSQDGQQALRKAGYRDVGVQQKPSTQPKGRIVGQTPQGNANKPERITLFVSTGKP